MANESLSYAELKNWYDAFNTMISNYGGSISSLSIPAQNETAKATNVNNIYNKINEFLQDEYLQTQPSLYDSDYSIVSSGSTIKRTQSTPISNTASSITSIKCRNKVSYSCGTNGSGAQSSGTQSNGSNSSGTQTNGMDSEGTKVNTRCSSGSNTNLWNFNGWGCNFNFNHNGNNSNGTNSNGTNSNSNKSNTSKSSGAIYDILNANTSY